LLNVQGRGSDNPPPETLLSRFCLESVPAPRESFVLFAVTVVLPNPAERLGLQFSLKGSPSPSFLFFFHDPLNLPS